MEEISDFISAFSFEIQIPELTLSMCCPVNAESLQSHLRPREAGIPKFLLEHMVAGRSTPYEKLITIKL